MGSLFGREPVAWMMVIRSGIMLATLFGFDLSNAQMAGIFMFAETVLALVTRQQVTPVAEPVVPAGVVVTRTPARE